MPEQIFESSPCSKCGEPILISEFRLRANGTRERRCTPCIRAAVRASYLKHRDTALPKRRQWNAAHREERREKDTAYAKQWQQKKRDEGYYRTPEKREKRKAYYLRVKIDVFEHYGGVFCNCCGVDDVIFLTLDHVAGDGASHRAMLNKRSSQNMYLWIRSQGYPPGFQVLCFNCNHGKHLSGKNVCPHREQRLQLAA